MLAYAGYMYVYMYAYVCIYVYICMYMYMYVYVCMCICICVYIYSLLNTVASLKIQFSVVIHDLSASIRYYNI